MKKRLLAVCSLSICMAAFAGCSSENIKPEDADITEYVFATESVITEVTGSTEEITETTEEVTETATEASTEAVTESEQTSAAKEAL